MTVKVRILKGDTLKSIAGYLEVSLSTLVSLNPQIKNINLIKVGQFINAPDTANARKFAAVREQVWTQLHSVTPTNTQEGNWGAWPAPKIEVALPEDGTPAAIAPQNTGFFSKLNPIAIGGGVLLLLALLKGKR